MEKLIFLVVLCVVGAMAGGPSYRLINDSTTATRPIVARTSSLTQPPPLFCQTPNSYYASNRYTPALFWGNSIVIKNVRPQNDSIAARKRLSPLANFAIENQTIAMTGQEYLIRPRGYYGFVSNDPNAKRFTPDDDERPYNNKYRVDDTNHYASRALTITPDYAAFRLTNTSSGTGEEIAFFNSDTIDSPGATFTLWASNPSAASWSGPGARNFNISDPSQAYDAIMPGGATRLQIEWLVACRWIANGTDCGDDAVIAPDVCALVEFGLCWARFPAPDWNYEQIQGGEVVLVYPGSGCDTSDRNDEDWSMYVAPRPLTLWSPTTDDFQFGPFDVESASTLSQEVKANQNTPSFVVGLPLNEESIGPEEASQFTTQGTTSNLWLRTFMPGKDNAGGTLEITVNTIIEVPSVPNKVSRAVTHIQMVPPKVVISAANPTASFYFTNITKPADVLEYVVHFLVTETSPSTATLANTTAAAGETNGIWPNGAYSIPALVLTPTPYDFELKNFPPGDGGNIEITVTPEALFNCSAAGNAYVAQLAATPASVGQDSISLPFNITPAGAIKFWTCPSAGGKRQATPTQITSFTFTGSTTAVVFYVTTQTTPISDVTVSFGTPVVSNSALLDPVGGFAFAQNGTFTFDVVQNDVHVTVTNNAGADNDETGGPFVNQDFYMQFQWTPATRNGFRIAISGLQTSFPASATVSNNGTTGTFTVPAGATGFLAGPFRAQSPPNLDAGDDSFDIVYSVSLVSLASGTSDNTWYRLPSALQLVVVHRHRFAVVNWNGDEYDVFTTGQKSRSFCIAPAFAGALSLTDQVWLSVVQADSDYGGWLIFDPVVPTPGAQPPNALLLNAATPMACFTARFDTNWQILDTSISERFIDNLGTVMPRVYLSGPSATTFQEAVIANMPQIGVERPEVSMTLDPSVFPTDSNEWVVGESVLLWVFVPLPPAHGLAYNVTLPGADIVPISAGAGQFTPTGALQHVWRVTFWATPVAEDSDSHAGDSVRLYWQAQLVLFLSGADAALYQAPSTIQAKIVPRQLVHRVAAAEQRAFEFEIDSLSAISSFWIQHPVLNSLTITPYLRSAHVTAEAVVFEPPSFTFTPTSVATVTFVATGVMLGHYEIDFSVTGPDANIYTLIDDPYYNADLDNNGLSVWIDIVQHSRPAMAIPKLDFIAGREFSGLLVAFPPASLSTDDITVHIDMDAEFEFSRTDFTRADGLNQYFSVKWVPREMEARESGSRLGWVTYTGADAWKYEATTNEIRMSTRYRTFDVSTAGNGDNIVGVRYTGRVLLDEPAPEGFSLWIFATGTQFYEPGATTPSNSATIPFIVTFAGPSDGIVKHFEYVHTVPVTVENSASDSVTGPVQWNYVLDSSFAGNRYFFDEHLSAVMTPRRRSFYVENLEEEQTEVYMVNRESPLFTVVVNSPPPTSVTLTISHPSMTFNGGQPAATLVFSAGALTATFSFMPTTLPHDLYNNLQAFDVSISGPDAPLFDAQELRSQLADFYIIPELGFSPIPAMYTDGSVSGLKVWLVDALAQGFSYDSQASFSLHLIPADREVNVYVEPSTLEFSPQSQQHNRLSQEFSLTHPQPSTFRGMKMYSLRWYLKFQGQDTSSAIDMSDFVPMDAQNVVLMRHQIFPEFPRRLNFGWQHASINVSRAPLAHMSLIPHGPAIDSGVRYGGSHSAGGRIVFDPQTIVFAPGQQVAHFMVKAIAGNDQNAVYYRVAWDMDGQADDLENYLDYVNEQSDAVTHGRFATWHIASSGVMQISFALLALVALLWAL